MRGDVAPVAVSYHNLMRVRFTHRSLGDSLRQALCSCKPSLGGVAATPVKTNELGFAMELASDFFSKCRPLLKPERRPGTTRSLGRGGVPPRPSSVNEMYH